MGLDEVRTVLSICSLSSGSSGNATVVFSDKTVLLVDCGINLSRFNEMMGKIGIPPNEINGILVTHEHQDHCKTVRIIAETFGIPVYLNIDTLIACKKHFGHLAPELTKIINCGTFEIEEIGVKVFTIHHDCAYPVGYAFTKQDKKIAIATDLGSITNNIARNLLGSDIVMLESNYDQELLENGSYPDFLKRRVMSDEGHLSNFEATDFATNLFLHGTKHVMFGHVSQNNNTEELIKKSMEAMFKKYNIQNDEFTFSIAPRKDVSEIYEA
jgi:phosphoribosyl 1,2-cyclic phosphodiesterase